MEAKDTVMRDWEIQPILDRVANKEKKSQSEVRRQIAHAQAEISFKAGYEQRKDEENPLVQRGIKEVVDWIRQNNNEPWIFSKADGSESHPASIGIGWHNWQAKLKEWGINADS